jgi:hypothetical protein
MWCAERASGFLLISCARQQSPRGGKRFPVVIVNQRTADGPQSRQTGLVDVNTHICCCRTLYFCSKLSRIFPLETSAVCQNLWTGMSKSSNVFIIFMLPNPELRTFFIACALHVSTSSWVLVLSSQPYLMRITNYVVYRCRKFL